MRRLERGWPRWRQGRRRREAAATRPWWRAGSDRASPDAAGLAEGRGSRSRESSRLSDLVCRPRRGLYVHLTELTSIRDATGRTIASNDSRCQSSCQAEGGPDVPSTGPANHPRPGPPHPSNLPEGLARRWRRPLDNRPPPGSRIGGRHADQAHHRVLPGEPLVRPLLRLRSPGPGRGLRPAAGLYPARRRGWVSRAVPLHGSRDAGRPARLGLRPRTMERRGDGRVHDPLRHLGDGLLHGGRAAVLLLALRRLDALR